MGILVGLYLAGLAFSLALAVVLWRRDRSQLNVDLVAVWIAGALSAILQGALNQSPFLIALGFSSTVLTNLALAKLIARLAGLALPFRRYLALYVAGVVLAFVVAQLSGPFWAIALPIALSAPFASAHAGVLALRRAAARLGTTGKAFIYTSFAFVAHNLDFPFLRDRPEFASLGLVVALFLVWTLAPTAMAAVLERTAEERGRLIEVEAQKSRFFANISHELRTPLTLILGPIQQLLSAEGSAQQKQSLHVMQRNAQRLLRMIDDLLDLARLEAGKIKLKVERFDLGKLIRDAGELLSPAAQAKNIRLELPAQREASFVWGDAHRIEIVVGNLLNNAIKYTQSGGQVRVELSGTEHEARVTVSDNGPGIPEADQARIFERFVRLAAGEAGSKGVGIGLSLSRELAEANGGALGVVSSPGQGASFTLRLPREALRVEARGPAREQNVEARGLAGEQDVEAREPINQTKVAQESAGASPLSASPDLAQDGASPTDAYESPIRLEGGRVPELLIVEDEPDMREFIRGVVAAQFRCTVAEDGEQALQLLQTFRPDLILTDVMMPGVTGLELCARIKRDLSLRAIPVMLLTARAGVEAAIEGYGVGADDFLSKPFHPRELLAHIRSHLTVRQLSLQLAEQARLATSGTLAAGVAHEIRNPLNAVLNALEALRDPETVVGRDELLTIAADGLRRIQTVTEALSVHVRPGEELISQPCDVRECVEATLRLLHHRSQHLAVHLDVPANLEVLAPARAFSQTLMNLLDNALREAKANLWLTLSEEAQGVRLVIEDDGPGVAHEVASRIFDPFFTTRDVGEGSGLGLYLSRKLARDVGGQLRYEPRPAGGARFVLELPRCFAG